ncbi:hypothetical protein KSZ_25920 [Dictyobacter formicarum]|uniref:EamA domain-containing protein n=1 Tax=Dictyobacter formicarum TaxID=2778368 RepID=A0ABQ3VHI3_9CHLR|nr:hypothetical protein KSZ_25920 [Dictyobacter formicarum]
MYKMSIAFYPISAEFTWRHLGKGAVLVSVLSAIGAVIVAVLIYHEKVTSYQLIGPVLGIAAILMSSCG